MDRLPNLIIYAIPTFVALIIAEMVWAKWRAPSHYHPQDMRTSLLLGLTTFGTGMLCAAAITTISLYCYHYRLATIPVVWWAWPLCSILDDFLHYWLHRAGHRVRWLWASHVNHHSSQHFNLSVALRQSMTGAFFTSLAFRVPLILIGLPIEMIVFVGAINTIYEFWTHSDTFGRGPRWFEYLMNTPSHHRVHHAVNPRYLDRNFAAVFMIWDRMFGTYAEEVEGEKIHYGIIKQLGTFNLMWNIFHEWIGIIQDLWTAPWRAKLSYFWGVPGWSHDGSRETSDMIRARWEAQQSG